MPRWLTRKGFGLADSEPAVDYQLSRFCGVLASEGGTGMSGGKQTTADKANRFFGQLQEAERVSHVTARFPNHLGKFILGKAETVDEAFEAFGFLDRVEVFSLKIFDESGCTCCCVGQVSQKARNRGQASHLGRSPTTLAGDDLKLAGCAGVTAYQDGLQQALLPNRGGKFHQILRRDRATWLKRVRLEIGNSCAAYRA